MLTKDESRTIIRVMPDHGSESSLEIEYADDQSDFYIIRSHGGFYLFREEVGDQDGFFYDFSSPDGGYGRFAYNPSQYFDSFMREIKLALPYDPYCAHMCEGRRSFGYGSNDTGTETLEKATGQLPEAVFSHTRLQTRDSQQQDILRS